jgi:hypothetical protein
LDTAFVALHPSLITKDVLASGRFSGNGWEDNGQYTNVYHYHSDKPFRIGNTELKYETINVYEMRKIFGKYETFDGIFNIPKNDTVNVWEWNFEHNYLEIHNTENFAMPTDCYVFPYERKGYYDYYVKIPVTIAFSDGNFIQITDTFLIDMGAQYDITILPQAKELEFFKQRDDAVWYEFSPGFIRLFKTDIMVFEKYQMDSIVVGTLDTSSNTAAKYILGLNFVKHFNMYIDRKKRVIGFQPIKNFQRIYPSNSQFYYYSTINKSGNEIVTMLADYKTNPFIKAGLKVGDEIIAKNGIPIQNITHENRIEFLISDTMNLDILRENDTVRLVVPINKMPVEVFETIIKTEGYKIKVTH